MLRVQVTISVNRNVGVSLQGRKNIELFSHGKLFTDKLCRGNDANFKTFASKNTRKKLKKGQEPETRTLQINKVPSEGYEKLKDNSIIQDETTSDIAAKSDSGNLYARSSTPSPSRKVVLQACSVSSVLILALGAALRQASHIAFTEGWLKHDSSTDVSFAFETWHLGLVIGLVILISSCRYILLKTWPDFVESSEAANEQVLSSLQPLDYVVVAFLPGISEELLFRGALLPFVGLNWKSALAIGAVFGILHLGSGRRYSYAVWATFVGFAYGMATIISSSIIVPMASHSLNNLAGGIFWRYESTSQEKST